MTLFNGWQVPLIAVGIGFHLSVSWALLWRYLQARERPLVIWSLAWLALTVHILGIFLTRVTPGEPALLVRDISFVIAAAGFFIGQAERDGWTKPSLPPLAAGSSILVGLAMILGAWIGAPVTMAAMTGALVCIGGATWLASPLGVGSRDATRWLLFAGYLFSFSHGAVYLWQGAGSAGGRLEILTQVLFSLCFSAAVTWQAWERDRAVRLFSRTLERLNRPLTTSQAAEEALHLMADVVRVPQGWVLLRHEGHDEWTVGATIGSGQSNGKELTIPLGANGQIEALMTLVIPSRRSIAPADMAMLSAMGEQIGLAIDRSRAYDELRSKEEARGRLMAQLITAQEDERRRIARELHDETGQALTALVVNLDFLVRHPVPEAALRERLAGVRSMAEGTLAEVRRVIHEMRPTVLDDLGLEAAIRWLVQRYEAAGLRILVDVAGLEKRLPGPVEITAFRVVQEACTNTVKHAKATHLRIGVFREPGQLVVQVSDNGKGMASERNTTGGMGLAGLKERVALAGGTLNVSSTPHEGTKVVAVLPLPDSHLGQGVRKVDPCADL